MWAPGNPLAHADGVVEDVEEFRTYLRGVLGEHYDAARVDAFLAAAPDMVGFFHERTALKFVPGATICDVYGDLPGAGTGHRSVGARTRRRPRARPDVLALLRHQLYETSFLGMGIMAGPDLMAFLSASRGNPRGLLHATRRRHPAPARPGHPPRGMQLVNGTALVGRLLSARAGRGRGDAGAHAGHRAAARRGRARHRRRRGRAADHRHRAASCWRRAGSRRTPPGARSCSRARRPAPSTGRCAARPPTARARRWASRRAAGSTTDGASPAAWCPVSLVPYRSGRTGVFPHIMDRAKPGSIGVLSTGKPVRQRGQRLLRLRRRDDRRRARGRAGAGVADRRRPLRAPLPARDGQAAARAALAVPAQRLPEARAARSRSWPRKCGIDPAGLVATVERFNAGARRGEDPDFGRGSTPFNRYGGDPAVGPNPSLGALAKGPFYAVRVVPGSFGTFAGLATDARARVLDADDTPIPGLYAVGNDQASVMGGHYPAGGINIGPAMTFGYIAGRALAGATAYEDDSAPAGCHTPG